jgi:hypothetical protein
MNSPELFHLQLLHGVQERARLPQALAAFRQAAAASLAGPTELYAGDAIEKGQTGPDRRTDYSGEPLFLAVTPLASGAGDASPLDQARQALAACARRVESWVLRRQFEHVSPRAQPASASDWLQIVMMNVEPSVEGEFNEWYEREHVARIAAVAPEFVSVRRLEALAGSPRYFALWRLTDRKAPERDPWLSASETPWTTRIRRYMRDRRRLLLAPYAT